MESAMTVKRALPIIIAEIRAIDNHGARVAADCFIEIGRRLCEAKEQVEHGDWGDFLRRELGYSQSTANNCMNLYKEYGNEQGSMFGASIKSQTFANLGYSKLLALLAVPADEREEFAAEHRIEDVSVRELKELLAKRDKDIEDMARENHGLATEKESLRQEKLKLVVDLKDAENAAESKLAKERTRIKKLEKELEAARTKAGGADDARLSELERERDAAAEQIKALEKKLKTAGDADMLKFKLLFDELQISFERLTGHVDAVTARDAEIGGRMAAALRAGMTGLISAED